MAVQKMEYRNLNHALKLFKVQVLEGIPYAQTECPKFDTPQEAFNWLKLRTKYKNDPTGTELFQTLPTLLENNFHGITGHGDCDCFTIAILSILAANNFKNIGIVLVGRNAFSPVHIYAYYIDENGEKFYLDLTNKYYNQTRQYYYYQEIPFKLTPKESNDMMLQLADDGLSRPRPRRPKPTPEQLKKYHQSAAYKKRKLAYDRMMFEKRKRSGQAQRLNPHHVWLPSKNMQIREDYFDNTLSNGEFQTMLLSEGYELEEIAELAGRRGDRRRAKKDEKRALKKEKKMSKVELRRAKAEKKKAKGEAAKERAAAKRDKYQNKGGGDGEDESEAESTAGRIFGKVIGGAKQVVGVYKSARGGGDDGGEEGGEEGGANEGGNYPTVRTKQPNNLPAEPKMVKIFGKEISQTTAILGGLGIAAVGVGVAVAISKSRKNKRLAA